MELNGADAKSAMLWFLMRERKRHLDDIEAINRDVWALTEQGVILPNDPPLDTFIRVPGVLYDEPVMGTGAPETGTDHIADASKMVKGE